jgi:hypothetical protein
MLVLLLLMMMCHSSLNGVVDAASAADDDDHDHAADDMMTCLSSLNAGACLSCQTIQVVAAASLLHYRGTSVPSLTITLRL